MKCIALGPMARQNTRIRRRVLALPESLSFVYHTSRQLWSNPIIMSMYPVNLTILHSNGEYDAWSESRFTCYSYCYVTWYLLTTIKSPHNGRHQGTWNAWSANWNLGIQTRQHQFDPNETWLQWICDLRRQLCLYFHINGYLLSNWNGASHWHGDNMVSHTRLRYTRDYLTPGICSFI